MIFEKILLTCQRINAKLSAELNKQYNESTIHWS
jgi:hypothetical protein